jgi:hypothetical protein
MSDEMTGVPEEHKNLIKDCVARNAAIFSTGKAHVGCAAGTTRCPIKTDPTSRPIRQRAYRIAHSQRQVVDKEVEEMLSYGIVTPSRSPWASPIVLVPKKTGGWRFCVDYRKLNAATIKDAFPMPNTEDVLSSFHGAKYFSTLDLRSGFWQVAMTPEDQTKTAFTTYRGLFEFTVMPFGLTNAPAVFQRMMNSVLDGLQHKFAVPYIDDIIVYSKSIEEHIEHLEIVFRRLAEEGLMLNPDKCVYLRQEISYLGHIVSAEGLKPDPAKIQSVVDMQAPTSVKEIRRFLGLTGYYRKFIQNYAKIAQPMTVLTKKNIQFHWNPQAQEAFETLKTALVTHPVLTYPDASKPYRLYTDASEFACGAVLSQESEDGEHPVQYVSKQFSTAQMKWPTYEREAFAIVHAVDKLRPYLYGHPFEVVTDHKPLQYILEGESKNLKVFR